jgi:hypothetical protein
MAHGIMIPSAVASLNVDSYVRHAKGAVDLDNGNVVSLTALTAVAGEREVWTAAVPATGATLTNLFMVGEPEIVLTSSKYKNIDPNVQNFYNVTGDVFSPPSHLRRCLPQRGLFRWNYWRKYFRGCHECYSQIDLECHSG